MNEVIKNLTERRSIRKFKPDQISEEQLTEILEAGKYAPSGMGKQPVKMVVIQDKDTIARLSKLNAEIMGVSTDPFYGAPTVIVVLANTASRTWKNDGSLTMGNLMNAAHSVGVGSCWIHRAEEEFKTPEGREMLKKWGIPETFEGVGHCVLGYCDGEYPAPARRREDSVVRV